MKLKSTFIRQMLLSAFLVGNMTFVFGQSSTLKRISGYVTHNKEPLKNVNVFIQEANRKAVTDDKGFYSIEASERDVIQYSFVGMTPVEIMVEDVTKHLNIKMGKEVSDLDEVLVQGDKNKSKKDFVLKKGKRPKISTAYGDIDRRSFSNNVQVIEGKDLWLGSRNIAEALQNQMALSGYGSFGFRPTGTFIGRRTPLWDIDGMIFNTNPPHVDLVDVAYVAILRSVASTTLYGMRGASGVIVVRTKGAMQREKFKEELGVASKTKYKRDALPYKNMYIKTDYIETLDKTSSNDLYDTYKTLSYKHLNSMSFFLDVSNFFRIEKGDKKLSLKVLKEMGEIFDQNPEALKALAYTYESIGEKKKAIDTYYKIIFLRSSYTQSFRDLANAYVRNKQYGKGWDMYMRYLRRGHKLQDKGIEQIVYNEMHSVYSEKKESAKIKEVFIPKDKKGTGESDIRIVFEWNTSEAEFELEFVDPKQNTFVYEQSLAKNSKRVADQKLKGYSSEEFFIYDMIGGDWLVNLTYLGNKKYEPTYVKATIYKDWGRKNQTEKVKVFKLTELNNKMQLFNFRSNKLSAISYN